MREERAALALAWHRTRAAGHVMREKPCKRALVAVPGYPALGTSMVRVMDGMRKERKGAGTEGKDEVFS